MQAIINTKTEIEHTRLELTSQFLYLSYKILELVRLGINLATNNKKLPHCV